MTAYPIHRNSRPHDHRTGPIHPMSEDKLPSLYRKHWWQRWRRAA